MEGIKEAVTYGNKDDALPAVTAPPGGPHARSPFDQSVESEHQGQEQMWEWNEDHLLPLANIINTMRRALPADAGVPSDAAAIIQRATSDFILLVTNQARERYNRKSHKKVKGDDIIWALNKIGFTDYVRPLELYLSRYWEHSKGTLHGNSMASPSMTAIWAITVAAGAVVGSKHFPWFPEVIGMNS